MDSIDIEVIKKEIIDKVDKLGTQELADVLKKSIR